MEEKMRGYFTHWNYKKHAKFCTAVYLSLYIFDMTVSYFICKAVLDKMDEAEAQNLLDQMNELNKYIDAKNQSAQPAQ